MLRLRELPKNQRRLYLSDGFLCNQSLSLLLFFPGELIFFFNPTLRRGMDDNGDSVQGNHFKVCVEKNYMARCKCFETCTFENFCGTPHNQMHWVSICRVPPLPSFTSSDLFQPPDHLPLDCKLLEGSSSDAFISLSLGYRQ